MTNLQTEINEVEKLMNDSDLKDLKELLFLLRMCSNNLNQYAKKANETGSIYQRDIADLKARLDRLWSNSREIVDKLSDI